jgi:redox-sensitive bicupin YhaK (pirin superfamily)
MITLRKASERGHFDFGWLDTNHSFSFGEYFDPAHVGFRSLRVINEDRVAPGGGFPTHGHRDMEILTYVLEGAIEHKDSLGTGSVIRPGDAQRMSAGSGVRHSEFNASRAEPAHFLQIWIVPEREGATPGYEQKRFDEADKRDRLRLIASRDARDGSIAIHQDADVYAGNLSAGKRVQHELARDRGAWLQVARGAVKANGRSLAAGDGAAIEDEPLIAIEATQDAEILLFDLA